MRATVTEAATPEGDEVGYASNDCWSHRSEPEGSVYFDRPWGPYATVLFRNSYLGDVNNPKE